MKSGFLNIILLVVIGAGLVLGGIGAYLAIPKTPEKKPEIVIPASAWPEPAPPRNSTTTAPVAHAPIASSSPASSTAFVPANSPTPLPILPPPPRATSTAAAIPLPPLQTTIAAASPQATFPATSPPPIIAATSSPQIVSSTPALPPAQDIDPGVIVGIVCDIKEEYAASDPQYAPVTETGYSRGTGVIIDKRGYILTNKHVGGTFVQKATTTIGYDEVTLTITTRNTGCWAGTLSQGTTLPTAQQIQTFNPLARIPVLAYIAVPLYEPSGKTFSELEKFEADFTVLKITGLAPDATTFGVTSTPASFPYAKLLPVKDIFKEGAPVLSYGAPADASAAKGDFFSTIYILGATGQLSKIEKGNKAFADVPLTVQMNMEVSGGRSGSPVFWNGYVIGLVQAYKANNKTQTRAVASDAILKYLRETHQWEPGQ